MVSHSDQFNIRWNNYTSVLQNVFRKLLEGEQFVDVTLACEGKSIKCHRVILSACSPYFEKILTDNAYPHLVIFVKDMKYWELQALVTFMYNGEVSVNQNRLSSLVKAAEALKIKGLAPDSSMTVNDTEKIDDDDIEEYHVGNLPNIEMDLEEHVPRNSHQMEEQSLLKPNFQSGTKKSNMKRKITISPPKLVKMQRMERNSNGSSSILSSQLSVLSPEVLLNSAKQPRQKNNKQETVVSSQVDDDDDTDYDTQNPEILDGIGKDEPYTDEEQEENGDFAEGTNSGEVPSSPSEPEEIPGTSSGSANGIGKYPYKYDKEIRDSAIAALNSGMSLRQCAESFGIPRKTLSKWKTRENSQSGEKDTASLKFSVKDLKLGFREISSPVGALSKKSPSSKLSSLSENQSGLNLGQASMSDTENKGVSLPPGLHPKKIRMIRKHRVEILSEAALCILKGNTFQHVSEVYDVPKTTLRDFMVRRGLLQRGPPRKSVGGPPGCSNSLSPTMKTDAFGPDGSTGANDSDIL